MKRNAFTERWHGREAELSAAIETEAPAYANAFAAGDAENGGVVFGEAAGLIMRSSRRALCRADGGRGGGAAERVLRTG